MKNAVLLSSLVSLFVLSAPLSGKEKYKFRVSFMDKAPVWEMLHNPDTLLSKRALSRRATQDIAIDHYDLPVAPAYVGALQESGYRVVSKSRWMNSAVIAVSDTSGIKKLRALPFVKEVQLVWIKPSFLKGNYQQPEDTRASSIFDESPLFQLDVHQLREMHEAGYQGEGVHIAVVDAGFKNAHEHPQVFQQVSGIKDFVNPNSNFFNQDHHGTNVLSVMAHQPTESYSGSAPKARYWLLRSEDAATEYPVEEDYWCAAAEYADSVGVDIINSSLGYMYFDKGLLSYTKENLTGDFAYITKACNIASDKGILVVNSAGNEGSSAWEYITFPADAPSIVSVGALNAEKDAASFTGKGYIAGKRVKPEISAMGEPTYVMGANGDIYASTGTSFSAPIIAGLAACLWQAFPALTNQELKRLMLQHSEGYPRAERYIGYGAPQAMEAYESMLTRVEEEPQESVGLIPLDENNRLWILSGLPNHNYRLELTNAMGIIISDYEFSGDTYRFNLINYPAGVYTVKVIGDNYQFTRQIQIL